MSCKAASSSWKRVKGNACTFQVAACSGHYQSWEPPGFQQPKHTRPLHNSYQMSSLTAGNSCYLRTGRTHRPPETEINPQVEVHTLHCISKMTRRSLGIGGPGGQGWRLSPLHGNSLWQESHQGYTKAHVHRRLLPTVFSSFPLRLPLFHDVLFIGHARETVADHPGQQISFCCVFLA